MIQHPAQLTEILSKQDVETILAASFEVLETKGMTVQSQPICDVLANAGLRVDSTHQKVYFSREFIETQLAKVPPQWTLHARNPQKSIEIGGPQCAITPGYGSPFIADIHGKRREALLSDFEKFASLSYASDVIDLTGGLLVEPNDIPPALRPLEITYALIKNSDKPFMGSVAGSQGASESIEMCKILYDTILDKPCILGLININSPLRLDSYMADALFEYVQNGQPVILTPGIMMGITAPATVAGATVQAFAELMGCIAIIQAIHSGCPAIIGLGGFGSDLRNGTTGFGRPENALGTQIGSQIARYLKIPFRCSATVTGSRKPDCRSGYERMMTALTAYHSGANFCLQAAGILDSINMMSYEQYVIDLEIWSYIERLSKQTVINSDTLGVDIIDFHTENYLGHEHTVRHMRNELFIPSLVETDTYEQWISNGSDIVLKSQRIVNQKLSEIQKPPLDEDIHKELEKYVKHRKTMLEHVS